MLLNAHILELVSRLVNLQNRQETAHTLAHQLGAEDLLIFIKEPEFDALLPAPGFPQTLPNGRAWRSFLRTCLQEDHHVAELPYPHIDSLQSVIGVSDGRDAVLALLGGHPDLALVDIVCMLLPLLAATFRGEQAARTAAMHVKLAHEAEAQTRALVEALESARHELQQALAESKQARQKAAFLAEVSTRLAESLTHEGALIGFAQFAVPFFADWCIVDILEADGKLSQLAVAHVDPRKERLIRELRSRFPPDPNANHAIWTAIHTRRSELHAQISDADLMARARDSEHYRLLHELDIASDIVVPLLARNRVFGALSFVKGHSGRLYGPDDLALAEELAHRVAIAVDNMRLYHEAKAAVELRDRFLSVASHELKTPLTSMIGHVQLLQRRDAQEKMLSERTKRALQVIGQQSLRLNKLIETMLDISRIQHGQLTIEHAPVDLCAVAQRVVEEIQPTLNTHSLVYTGPSEAVLIQGDALRLEQVLQNLIGNAIKYSPLGGEVQVRIEQYSDCGYVFVTDHGIGIPKTALPQLFQRFFRADNIDVHNVSGMGIGLYIVKEIVTKHGGSITVESVEGEGTTVGVALPLLETSPEHAQTDVEPNPLDSD